MRETIKESEIEKGVMEGFKVGLNCYTPVTSYIKNLDHSLRVILKVYDKPDLHPIIFGVTQEMVRFSTMSNKRYLYYKKNNFHLDSEETFLKYEPDFLKSVTNHDDFNYREDLIQNKMYVSTVIDHNDVGINIKVYNMAEHQLDQEFYMRNYLKLAMNYTNVMEYFNDHPEDPQGRNLGLALSIIILKESGLRPDLMRMGKPGSRSYSRIEIPFNVDTYKSIRDRILNDESIVPFEKPNLIPAEYKEQFEARKRLLEGELTLHE
jgi:hypothetical protein